MPTEKVCSLVPNHLSLLISPTASTPEPQTPGPSTQGTQSSGPEYEEILIKIVYSLRNPVDGVQFVVPTDSYPYVRSSAYVESFIP